MIAHPGVKQLFRPPPGILPSTSRDVPVPAYVWSFQEGSGSTVVELMGSRGFDLSTSGTVDWSPEGMGVADSASGYAGCTFGKFTTISIGLVFRPRSLGSAQHGTVSYDTGSINTPSLYLGRKQSGNNAFLFTDNNASGNYHQFVGDFLLGQDNIFLGTIASVSGGTICNFDGYLNGEHIGPFQETFANTPTQLLFGTGYPSDNDVILKLAAVWFDALTVGDAMTWQSDPWSIFQAPTYRRWASFAAPPPPTGNKSNFFQFMPV